MIYVLSGYSSNLKKIIDYGYYGSENDAKKALLIHSTEEFKQTFTIRTI
jgi:hypothetical protein